MFGWGKIATDAAHLLADLASFMISLLALYIANRKSTKRWVEYHIE